MDKKRLKKLTKNIQTVGKEKALVSDSLYSIYLDVSGRECNGVSKIRFRFLVSLVFGK